MDVLVPLGQTANVGDESEERVRVCRDTLADRALKGRHLPLSSRPPTHQNCSKFVRQGGSCPFFRRISKLGADFRVGYGRPVLWPTVGVWRPAAMPGSRLKEPTMLSEPLKARLLLMFDLVVLMVLNPATSSAPTALATASCLSSATR